MACNVFGNGGVCHDINVNKIYDRFVIFFGNDGGSIGCTHTPHRKCIPANIALSDDIKRIEK